MGNGQWDILIYHDDSRSTESLVALLKENIRSLERDVGEEIKVASTTENFPSGCQFDSMEDALERCSYLFILITDDLLKDPMKRFINSQALTKSVRSRETQYIPAFESRSTMASMAVPSYIRSLHSLCINDMLSPLRRKGLVTLIKSRLPDRKARELAEQQQEKKRKSEEQFKKKIDEIKLQFEKQCGVLKGTVQVNKLKQKCAEEIQKLLKDQNISDVGDFLHRHSVDVSFAVDNHDEWIHSLTLSLSESPSTSKYDEACPPGGRVATEQDDAIEHGEVDPSGVETSIVKDNFPPTYSKATTLPVASPVAGNGCDRSSDAPELKMQPLSSHLPEPDSGAPLVVPPCPNELEPPSLLPTVLDDMQSVTSFSLVPRGSGRYNPDTDAGSMVAECSDSIQDTASLLGSQSHANLADLDEENISQFSEVESQNSVVDDVDITAGDNSGPISMLDMAIGQRPLPSFDQLHHEQDWDDESMIVEVDSTVGGDVSTLNLAAATEEPASAAAMAEEPAVADPPLAVADPPLAVADPPLAVADPPLAVADPPLAVADPSLAAEAMAEEAPIADPPLRVMHRSIYQDDEDFDPVRPLEIDVDAEKTEDATQISPGLGELMNYSWPRGRLGSDAGGRRPRRTNLTNRFLSLSSLQSFSTRLFRLHQQPSLNNICELRAESRILDGIRSRYS